MYLVASEFKQIITDRGVTINNPLDVDCINTPDGYVFTVTFLSNDGFIQTITTYQDGTKFIPHSAPDPDPDPAPEPDPGDPDD